MDQTISFSVDLVEQALSQLSFLKIVDDLRELQDSRVLSRAVYRYEKFWLPLAAEHRGECLLAPIDIEWVWHCHMLAPYMYAKDCTAVVDNVINHTSHKKADYNKAMLLSEGYWYQKYGDNTEPFQVIGEQPIDICLEHFQSKITYNILAAAERQRSFIYHVSLPHYRDRKFLCDALQRYKQFLFMKTKFPDAFIVPCYDIDLLWHAHQVNPVAYPDDTKAILGYLLNHDDDVGDRGGDSDLQRASMDTRKYWKELFDEPFTKFGAMHRGCSASYELYQLTEQDTYKLWAQLATISIDTVKLFATDFTGLYMTYIPERGVGMLGRLGSKRSDGQAEVFFNTDLHKHVSYANKTAWFKFVVIKKTGFACCKDERRLAEKKCEIDSIFPVTDGISGEFHRKVHLGQGMHLNLHGSFTTKEITNSQITFYLQAGKYETKMEPDDFTFGTVHRASMPHAENKQRFVASHKLRMNGENGPVEPTFTAETRHSTCLMMSDIRIFYHGKMAAVAHLIGSDQLPQPHEVDGECVTVDTQKTERAVLIKNHTGDWGILTGYWKGYKKGVAGTPEQKGIRGSPGTLATCFYKISTGCFHRYAQDSSWRYYKLENLDVDLMTGTVRLRNPTPEVAAEVAEHLALAFSVSLLHVLCVPRHSGWKGGQEVMQNFGLRGDKEVTPILSDELKFVQASGLTLETPSNHYIRSKFGEHTYAMCGGHGETSIGYSGRDDADEMASKASAVMEGDGCVFNDGGGCGGCGGRKPPVVTTVTSSNGSGRGSGRGNGSYNRDNDPYFGPGGRGSRCGAMCLGAGPSGCRGYR